MLHWVPRGSPHTYGYFDWKRPVDLDALNARLRPLGAGARFDHTRVRVDLPSVAAVEVASVCLAMGGEYGMPSSRFGDRRHW